MTTEEKDIAGIWYNDEFLMAIENGRVRFNTNIDTRHKPFYTRNIFDESLTLTHDEKGNFGISDSLTIVGYKPGKESMIISFTTDRIILAPLTRFVNE